MLFQIIIWILALYGFLEILLNLFRNASIVSNINDMYILVAVKNQEDTIEGIIRSIVFKNIYNKNDEIFNNIIVADMGSTDKTIEILNKLNKEYTFLKVVNYKDSKDILGTIMQENV